MISWMQILRTIAAGSNYCPFLYFYDSRNQFTYSLPEDFWVRHEAQSPQQPAIQTVQVHFLRGQEFSLISGDCPAGPNSEKLQIIEFLWIHNRFFIYNA
tara:strand:+ start:2081 stop:2377 length:297 start_codon:yes stop_codon:yes gene_type:complete